MPARTTTKPESYVEAQLSKGSEKVHSVVYNGDTPDGERLSIYIPRSVLKTLGNPRTVTVRFS